MAIPNSFEGEIIIELAKFLEDYCAQFGETVSWQSYTDIIPPPESVTGAIAYFNPARISDGSYHYTVILRLTIRESGVMAGFKKAGNWFGFIRDYALHELRKKGLTITLPNGATQKIFRNLVVTGCHYPKVEISQDSGIILGLEFTFDWLSDGLIHPTGRGYF